MILSYFWRFIFLLGYARNMAVKKYSISVPEDVAEQLDNVANVSEYVTTAVRLRRRGDRLKEVFSRHGITVTPEGVASMSQRLADQQARRARRSRQQAA